MSFILLGILNSQTTSAVASDFELLETTLVSSDTSTITFSSLNNYSAYKHLQLRCTIKTGAGTTGTTEIYMRINGDTGSNYAVHRMRGDGTSVSANNATSQTAINFEHMGTNRDEDNIYVSSVIDILEFSNSSKKKTIRALYGTTPSSNSFITQLSGFRNNTAAITSISLYHASNNIVAGSRFSLYGWKG